MADYTDCFFTNIDGLSQHYRDYNQARTTDHSPAPVILCLPGLTRNARDFELVANQFKDRCRLICAEQRGRGLSEYDPQPERYMPATYVGDMVTLLAHLGLEKVHVIATSLGGLMTMILQASRPGTVQSAIINDIGPEIDPRGLERIKNYVGKTKSLANWDEARDSLKTLMGDVYPDYDDARWMLFARQIYTERGGKPAQDYDPNIALPFKENSAASAPELWPLFDAMKTVPLLVVRGGLSDILSAKTLEKMMTLHPDGTSVTVKNVGHAPLLDEPECTAAFEEFARKHYF